MGGGRGGGIIQAYETRDSCSCKVHTPTKTMWTCTEWYLDVQEEACFLLY